MIERRIPHWHEIVKIQLLNLSFISNCYYKETGQFKGKFLIEHDGGENVIASVIHMYRPIGLSLEGDTSGFCTHFQDSGLVCYRWEKLS